MSDRTGDCPDPENAACGDKVFLHGNMTLLTCAEREAIEGCISDDEAAGYYTRAATLRGLLERTK